MAFWADNIVDEIERRYKSLIESEEALVIRDEKTGSGRVHVGSMRSASMHGVVSEILTERGIKNTFYFELNDFDPMDGLPSYLDEAVYKEHMGKPLYTIPSPDGKAKNFAEYYLEEYVGVIEDMGFHPETYRTSELYLSGKMNDVIRLALEKASDIRKIYKEVSGSIKDDNWFPLSVVCEACGKIGTTKVTAFDGEQVTYSCIKDMVTWAEGCGHEGKISPFDGNAKFPWKVDWAAKFKVMNVSFEGAGKDHYGKGGAREVSDRIAKEVFSYDPPYGVPNEFFLVGGKKMSSSKGAGSSAREIADLLPPQIFRLALLGKNINRQINFEPEGDTIPLLYDQYDRIGEKYWSEVGDDDARLFELIHAGKPPNKHFLPRFSQVAFLVQMPHIKIEDEVTLIKGEPLSKEDKEELAERAEYAQKWLNTYAPDEYKYELKKDHVPERAKSFTPEQKKALAEVLRYIDSHKKLEGQELHTQLHEIRKESGVEPKDFFSSIYLSFLDKESGPKAGWFLSVLDREFLTTRLKEVSA